MFAINIVVSLQLLWECWSVNAFPSKENAFTLQTSQYNPHLTLGNTMAIRCTNGLKITDPFVLCTHSLFLCFLRRLQKTVIISLTRITRLVFVAVTQCVY